MQRVVKSNNQKYLKNRDLVLPRAKERYKPHPRLKGVKRPKTNTPIEKEQLKRLCIEYKGGKCIDCGIEHWREEKAIEGTDLVKVKSNVAIFDFHHVEFKKREVSEMLSRVRSFLIIKPELDKCVLLCSNCHRLRHAEEGYGNSNNGKIVKQDQKTIFDMIG